MDMETSQFKEWLSHHDLMRFGPVFFLDMHIEGVESIEFQMFERLNKQNLMILKQGL